MICIACSKPGTICSLLNVISPPAADIKPFLVSRSTTHNGDGNMPVPITNSAVERIQWIRRFQNDAPCKAPDCTSSTVPDGTMLQKVIDNTSDIVLRYRLLNTKHMTDKAVI